MKILHINTIDKGGAGKAVLRLHNDLLKNNIDSNLLLLHKTDSNISNSFQYKEKQNSFYRRGYNKVKRKVFHVDTWGKINSEKLKNRLSDFEMFSFANTDYDITTQSIYKQTDIINLHWISGFIDYSFFKKNKKPVIWTLHDMNPFTGGCHFSNGCQKYMDSCSNCPQLIGTISSNNSELNLNYKKNNLNENIEIVTVSKWMLKNSLNSCFKNYKNHLIYNSMDTDIFKIYNQQTAREKFLLPPDKKILLFISAIVEHKRKGYKLLIDALKKISFSSFHLCVVGESSFETGDDNVTHIGKVDDERIMAMLYSASDAFILPSIEDNLPNTMLEALSCGIPVISFPVGGMLDIIKTGFNGILSEDVSVVSLSNSINDFIQDKYTFNKEEIRKFAIEKFSSNKQANDYIELYKSLL